MKESKEKGKALVVLWDGGRELPRRLLNKSACYILLLACSDERQLAQDASPPRSPITAADLPICVFHFDWLLFLMFNNNLCARGARGLCLFSPHGHNQVIPSYSIHINGGRWAHERCRAQLTRFKGGERLTAPADAQLFLFLNENVGTQQACL